MKVFGPNDKSQKEAYDGSATNDCVERCQNTDIEQRRRRNASGRQQRSVMNVNMRMTIHVLYGVFWNHRAFIFVRNDVIIMICRGGGHRYMIIVVVVVVVWPLSQSSKICIHFRFSDMIVWLTVAIHGHSDEAVD
jgi:hypothetical protein